MNIDHDKLDNAIGDLLDRYKFGDLDRLKTVSQISHVIQAVDQGNETEVLAFVGSNKVAD